MTRGPAETATAAPLPSPKERRRLREAKSLSEEQVATAIGVTPATVRDWEAGRTHPRGRKRAAYVRLIGNGKGPGGGTGKGSTGSGKGPGGTARPGSGAGATRSAPSAAGRARTDRRPTARPSPPVPGDAPADPQPSGDGTAGPSAVTAASTTDPVEATGSSTVSPTEPDSEEAAAPATQDARGAAERDAPSLTGSGTVGPGVPGAGASPADVPGTDASGADVSGTDASDLGAGLTAEEAFDALYTWAAPGLIRQTYLLTGRRALSREAVERAFQTAWDRWPEVAVDRDPAGWVRAVAYEYAMSPWHRMRRAHRHPDTPPTDPARRALLDALLELPPANRRTLLLYDGVGMDLPETAAETEASTLATAARLVNARAAVAERLPELAEIASPAEQSELLGRRLTELALDEPAPALPAPRAVRAGSERKATLWTRSAIAFGALLIGATAFTLHTAPTRYEQPISPAERVNGVPPRGGPEKLTPQDLQLQKALREHLAHGPERLVPQIR
ncbi:helix-turn-helix domain-containing protein [uncultured Streptomyces sp.]|uniref:helix-turn-helix domain-containing protein n=1 Tax=uncultured Streptomyces sp. TaxID=174707 RepID=UPI00260E3A8D|nr:helix-turn-helix domain-containing protein [uncultured Streptomyces sp.]